MLKTVAVTMWMITGTGNVENRSAEGRTSGPPASSVSRREPEMIGMRLSRMSPVGISQRARCVGEVRVFEELLMPERYERMW
jgi:hypothetical protein